VQVRRAWPRGVGPSQGARRLRRHDHAQ
jgi:hypothetical protein